MTHAKYARVTGNCIVGSSEENYVEELKGKIGSFICHVGGEATRLEIDGSYYTFPNWMIEPLPAFQNGGI